MARKKISGDTTALALVKPEPPPEPAIETPEAQVSTAEASSFSAPLTRTTLSEYAESQAVRNAKRVIPRIFRALAKGIDQGDRKCLELGMQAYSLVGKGGGVTVINNMLQNNNFSANKPGAEEAVYFESIVKRMDSADERKSDVIDAEVV